MKKYILLAFGKDRPGIVSSISKKLLELNANIEDSSMTKLEDVFVITLIFSTNEELKDIKVEDVNIYLSKIDASKKEEKGNLFLLRIYGADKPGIVYSFSEILAKNLINIESLKTFLSSSNLYMMNMEILVPENIDIESFKKDLEEKAKELKVDFNLEEIGQEDL